MAHHSHYGISGVLIKRNGAGWERRGLKQFFNAPNCLGLEQNIPTNGADFGWDTIDDDHLASISHRMQDIPFFVLAGATVQATFHFHVPSRSGLSTGVVWVHTQL
jgi:hypothetical protein